MGTGSFPGVKRPGRDVDHPASSSSEVKERVELYLYSTSGHSSSSGMKFTFNNNNNNKQHDGLPRIIHQKLTEAAELMDDII